MRFAEKYLILNGKIQPSQSSVEKFIDISSWISSSFIVRWRSSGTRIPFYSDQYQRLISIITFLGKQATGLEDEKKFQEILMRLIQKNRLFKGVELIICLKPAGNYTDKIDYLVICKTHLEEKYVLNDKGLLMTRANPSDHPGFRTILEISQDSFEASFWDCQAAVEDVDILYFTNKKKQLLETTKARIYLIKGNRIFTPAYKGLNTWGIDVSIEKTSKELGLQFSRSSSILSEHLNQADELFIANDLIGIQWVMGYNDKRFFKKRSPLIIEKINGEWEGSN